MEDVAVACNVSKGSLYNYFKNKNALIVAAFTALMEKNVTFFFEEKKHLILLLIVWKKC